MHQNVYSLNILNNETFLNLHKKCTLKIHDKGKMILEEYPKRSKINFPKTSIHITLFW